MTWIKKISQNRTSPRSKWATWTISWRPVQMTMLKCRANNFSASSKTSANLQKTVPFTFWLKFVTKNYSLCGNPTLKLKDSLTPIPTKSIKIARNIYLNLSLITKEKPVPIEWNATKPENKQNLRRNKPKEKKRKSLKKSLKNKSPYQERCVQ